MTIFFRNALLIIFLLTVTSYSQNRICVTVDDLPFVSYGNNDSIWQTGNTGKLLTAFTNHNIPVIGFVNEGKLYDNDGLVSFKLHLLEMWLDAGFDLGNHTFSHPDFNKTPFTEYTDDIIKGETHLKNLLAARNKTLKYFRHPFLYVGSTLSRADSLARFLAQRNYTVAPVTIDNDDYIFAVCYHHALKK